jgi:hypothetical protein
MNIDGPHLNLNFFSYVHVLKYRYVGLVQPRGHPEKHGG